VVIACFIAATGGMLFGYDLGVTGQFVTGYTVVHLSSAQTQKSFHCKSSLTFFIIVHRWCVIFPVFLEPLLPRGAGRKGQECLLYLQQSEAADLHFFLLPCWYCLLLLLCKRGHDIIDAASHCAAILFFAAVHADWLQSFAYHVVSITDRLCQLAFYSIALADPKQFQTLRKVLSIAGAVAGLISHLLNARLGRKWCMVIAGFWFTIGAVINCAAQDLAMLYLGRILLGFGVGFANQSVSICQPSTISAVDLLIASACPVTSAP